MEFWRNWTGGELPDSNMVHALGFFWFQGTSFYPYIWRRQRDANNMEKLGALARGG